MKTKRWIQPEGEALHRNSTPVVSLMVQQRQCHSDHRPITTIREASMGDKRHHIMAAASMAGHNQLRPTTTRCSMVDSVVASDRPQECIRTSEVAHIVATTASVNITIRAMGHLLDTNQARHIHLTTIITSNTITVEWMQAVGQQVVMHRLRVPLDNI